MSQEEVLRLVAKARDDASPALRKIRENLAAVKEGSAGPRDATRHLKGMHEEATRGAVELKKQYRELREHLDTVTSRITEGVEPAFRGLGIRGLAATGAVATLGEAIRNFAERGNDLTGFARQARLTTDTIRGMEGVASIFNVDPSAVRQSEQALTDAMYKFRRHKGEFYAYLKAQRPDDAAALAITPETVAGNEKALQLWLDMLQRIRDRYGDAAARSFSKDALGSDTFVDMLNKGTDGLSKAIERYNAAAGAFDPSKGKAFAENLADFRAALEGLSNSAGDKLLPEITKGVHELSEAIKVYGPGFSAGLVESIQSTVEAVREAWPSIKDTFEQAGPALRKAIDDINPIVQEMGGWKPVFEGLAIIRLTSFAASITGLATAVSAFGGALNLIPLATLAAIAKYANDRGVLKDPKSLDSKDMLNSVEPGLGDIVTKDPRPDHEQFQKDRQNLNQLFHHSSFGGDGSGGLMSAHSEFETAVARGTASGVVKGLNDFSGVKSMGAGSTGGLQNASYTTFGSGGGSGGRMGSLKPGDDAGQGPVTGNVGRSGRKASLEPGDEKSLAGQGPVTGNVADRGLRLMRRLITQGWTPEGAATAAGNGQQESGVRSDGPLGDTARFGFGDDAAHGMFQWRGARFRALRNFAASRGTSWKDFDTQADFFNRESAEHGQRGWRSMHDLVAANRQGKAFEGYGDNSFGPRLANSRRMLELWNKHGKDLPAPGEITRKSDENRGAVTRVHGTGELSVKVQAPRGTSVAASGGGLFKTVRLNRGYSMTEASETG